MILEFIRTNKVVAFILAALRLYLGFKWLTSGWAKISGGEFDASGLLHGAVANENTASWWATFLENFALPNVAIFNVVVPWGEFLVGLGLIVGLLTVWAAFFGMVMNFSFLFSGVISVNPIMIIMALPILVAGTNAGKIGLDHFARPFIMKKLGKQEYSKQMA